MVGMVILNYNDYKTVKHLYDIVKNYKSIAHIVIVDNCSDDGSYEELESTCECTVLRTKKNGGYSYGNNYGIRWLENNCPCEYYIVSNPDVEFDEAFVKKIVNYMEIDKRIGIMSGVMLERNGQPAKSQFGVTTGYWKAVLECLYIYRRYQMHYAKHQVDKKKMVNFVQVVWGSLFIISACAYRKIDGFDENTFLYHEENIISERIKNSGYKEAILTNVSYIHMHAVTISKATSRMKRHKLGMESQYYFQCHYHNLSKAKRLILKSMIRFSIAELAIINRVLYIFGK